jgi:hypothetical protein
MRLGQLVFTLNNKPLPNESRNGLVVGLGDQSPYQFYENIDFDVNYSDDTLTHRWEY